MRLGPPRFRVPAHRVIVSGVAGNAGLIAITVARLRELDPGWPGVATATAPATGTPDADDDTDD